MSPRVPGRRLVPWAIVVAGLLAVGILAGPGASGGPPLDPASTGASGTKALVETLRLLGANVSVQSAMPGQGDGVALLLVDDLDEPGRQALSAWVEAGGRLVLTDPASPLNPASPEGQAKIDPAEPELLVGCRLPALERLERVRAPGAVLLNVPAGGTGCFPGTSPSWMVVVPSGLGTVVTIGGPGAFVNEELPKLDNALLAVTLLAAPPGQRVVVLEPPVAGAGQASLGDLIPLGVRLALVQLAVAFGVFAAWRARRLGLPVAERRVVELPASELVAAVGHLTQRSRGRAQAAAVLRNDLRRTMARRLGLPADVPAAVLAEVVVSRRRSRRDGPATVASNELLLVLEGPESGESEAGGDVKDEASLVALARSIEELRREVTRG